MNTLSELKRSLQKGTCFLIVEHFIKPELTGQIREVNIVQTNGIYSKVKDEPDNPVSTANYGKGYWMPFDKAKNWEFKNGEATCTNIRGVKSFTIRVLGETDFMNKEDVSV